MKERPSNFMGLETEDVTADLHTYKQTYKQTDCQQEGCVREVGGCGAAGACCKRKKAA